VAANEDIIRNTDVLIKERAIFAQKMLEGEDKLRPDNPSQVIYWDITYFETCIVAHRARAKRGKPAVVRKGHRGIYIPMDESVKKRKSKKK